MVDNKKEEDGASPQINELEYTLRDLDLLLAYLGKNGKNIPPEIIATLVECKHYGPPQNWTQDQETKFWQILNTVTALIKPVTLTSLKTFAPNLDYAYGGKADKSKGKLNSVIFRYGTLATIIVFLIIGLQTYHLVGQDVLSKSRELFDVRNEVRSEIKRKEVAAKKIAEAMTSITTGKTPSSAYPEKQPGYIDENIKYETLCGTEPTASPFQANYEETLNTDEDYQILKDRDRILDQEFDANRTIMFHWNSVWRLGIPPTPALSIYDQNRYNSQISVLAQQLLSKTREKVFDDCGECLARQILPANGIRSEGDQEICPQRCNLDLIAQTILAKEYSVKDQLEPEKYCRDVTNIKTQLAKITVQKSLHQSRDLYFRAMLNATFVLNLLNNYLLPMLYGCLGALAMVLRSLCKSIKEETFTSTYALDYNMRIVLGTVSGMAAGLFLGDSGPLSEGSFSLMMIAFVLGYNVDVLFSLVDSIASKMTPDRHEPPTSEK